MAAVEHVATEGSSDRSVRDDILASIKEVEDRETPPEPETRTRDEGGRFIAQEPANKEKAPAITEPEPEPAREEAQVSTPPAAIPQAQVPFAAAPASWSNGAKAKWNALDADLRAEIAKREADVHKGFTKMDEERAFAKDMQRVIAPYEAIIRSTGASVPAVLQNVLNTVYVLRTADVQTKAQALRQVCEQYGVDPALLSQSPQIDPALSATQQRLAQLEQQLQQQTQAQHEAVEQEIASAIQAFGQDPKHPHFNAVQVEMGALMQAGRAATLDEAYDMAIWARPDLRAQLQAEQSAQQRQQATQKVQQARAKAVSVRGGPGGYQAPAPKANASVRDDLEAAFEEARGRI